MTAQPSIRCIQLPWSGPWMLLIIFWWLTWVIQQFSLRGDAAKRPLDACHHQLRGLLTWVSQLIPLPAVKWAPSWRNRTIKESVSACQYYVKRLWKQWTILDRSGNRLLWNKMKASCRSPSVCASLLTEIDSLLDPLQASIKQSQDALTGFRSGTPSAGWFLPWKHPDILWWRFC